MKSNQSLPDVSEKALAALKVLAPGTRDRPMSAKAIARMLWPDKYRECGTSLRRGGLYRSAGAYCSKLEKLGLVRFHMDDFYRGYYLSPLGKQVLDAAKPNPGVKADVEAEENT